jgi:predicted deacylase
VRAAFEIAELEVAAGATGFTRLPVASLLVGTTLTLPVHVVHGREPGPVLGLMSGVHGAEYLPMRVLRQAIAQLDPAELRGTVLALPVANPVSFMQNSRITLEDDIDFGNLNRVFPGVRDKSLFGVGESHPSDRTLTEMIAEVISQQFLPRLDHLLDFHTHFRQVSVVKVIRKQGGTAQHDRVATGMARAFGLGLIHGSAMTPSTATGYAAELGISSCVPEVGGTALTESFQIQCVDTCVTGIWNILRYLEMLPGQPELPERQLVFQRVPHVRPTVPGYLVTHYDPEALLGDGRAGVPVKAGDALGTIFDPHTFAEVETLTAPVDGVLYMTRRSGPIEAGGHAYAVAAFEGASWIE